MKKRGRILGAIIVSVFLLSTVVLFIINSKADASSGNNYVYDEMATGDYLDDANVIWDDSTIFLPDNGEDGLFNNNANENNVDEMAAGEYLDDANVIWDDSTVFESN